MTPDLLLHLAVRPALLWLETLGVGVANDRRAVTMMLAIPGQETGYLARRQSGNGPAMGFWQMEKGGGVKGVLTHPASKPAALELCARLLVPATPDKAWAALEHNDILAAAFARLLLFTDPQALPEDGAGGWALYARVWRPGKPHPETWPRNWQAARRAVESVNGGP